MEFSNVKYVKDESDKNAAIKFVLDGMNMSVLVNSNGNKHYDEITRQKDAGTITIAAAD